MSGATSRPTRLACRLIAGALAAAALALTAIPATDAAIRYRRAGAATMGAPDAIAGARDFCEVCTRCQGAHHAWASFEGGSECIAYYPTAGIDQARTAVLFLDGDVPGSYHFDEARMLAHLTAMRRFLEVLSHTYGVPFAYVARPGTFGSTGNHRQRRGIAEYRALTSAADRIRDRHGLARLVLAGQSGGATAVAAMLTLGLGNVACAVPASGGYDLEGMIAWHARQRGVELSVRRPLLGTTGYSVMDHIGAIPRSPTRRIFVLGDPEDRVTPFAFQQAFAQRVSAAGHHAVLLSARAVGKDRHGLAGMALRLAGLCAAGRPDTAIRAATKSGR